MALADDLAKLEKDLEVSRRRFCVNFYTIHNHLQDPNAPYFVSADLISSGSANPAVILVGKAQSILAIPGAAQPLP